MAGGISIQAGQVVKAMFGFFERVPDHVFAVAEGSLAHVVWLGCDFGCKVRLIVYRQGHQIL